MAVDMFMKIGDIKGESADKDHSGEIDVLAWSWGASQSGSMHVGGGGGAGKVAVQDLSLTKWVDKASANLLLHCCNGKHIKECKLVVRKAGEKPVEYMTIVMNSCLISSVSTGGSGGEDRLTENVTINFGTVKFSYQPQGADGAADGGAIEMGWDISKNVEA
jgi:type VI secretion system secreted protein Hcp